jgi:hypothetical protein
LRALVSAARGFRRAAQAARNDPNDTDFNTRLVAVAQARTTLDHAFNRALHHLRTRAS